MTGLALRPLIGNYLAMNEYIMEIYQQITATYRNVCMFTKMQKKMNEKPRNALIKLIFFGNSFIFKCKSPDYIAVDFTGKSRHCFLN